MSSLESHLRSAHRRALLYEDLALQAEARAVVPLDRLKDTAARHGCDDENERREALLLTLMRWFRHDFFSWFEPPACSVCQHPLSACGVRTTPLLPQELASRCEQYECRSCDSGQTAEFRRYNHPRKLLSTRVGRCGEWANCFGLFCRALGWRTRCVDDLHDHVWLEVYSEREQRWLHCDPCETALDRPLIYERGWHKRVQYVVAGACDHVADVTFRYSADFAATTDRRRLMTETALATLLIDINAHVQRSLSAAQRQQLAVQQVQELAQLLTPPRHDDNVAGRQSGSLAWRLSRGELGAAAAFVYRPTPSELADGRLSFSYCVADDSYTRGDQRRPDTHGWSRRVWQVSGGAVQRKHELDWRMVYLCRGEHQLGEVSISWLVDVTQHEHVTCGAVHVRCSHAVFHGASVQWSVTDPQLGSCVHLKSGGCEQLVSELAPCRQLVLTARLAGGSGADAFQHAQLLRAADSDTAVRLELSVQLVSAT